MERVFNRKGHETLYGDHKLISSVVVRIFHQFKDISFDRHFLFSKGIHKSIEIPFLHEINNFDELMGEDMIKELTSIFEEHEPG
jgi:hypothetical protein